MNDAPLVTARGLSVIHRDATRALPNAVDLTVSRGEAVLVLGPSGCGKSTLALALTGLIPRSIDAEVRGEISLGGDQLSALPHGEPATRAATVFQDPDAQVVTATVFDEVAFGAENLCVAAPEIDRRAENALRRARLWERRDDNPDALSGGGRQRLAIAAALAQGAPLVILDEPTANLDPRGAREVYDTLGALVRDRAIGALLIEHNLDEALRIATRVVVLDHNGHCVIDADPHTVFNAHTASLEALGVWQPVAALAARQLRASGWQIGDPLTLPELRSELERATAPAGLISTPSEPARHRSGEALVDVRHLSVDRAGHRILDDVSLQIPRGSFVAVAGSNGAGKTTLLRAIAGIERPPREAVTIDGRDVSRLRGRELRDRVGFVFQNPEHQFLATTVWDELALELRAQGFAEDAVRERVGQSLDRFGLAEVSGLHPFLLSGGQKRRLSVATALIAGAPCLVLDEPTYGQDRARAAELVAVLRELHAAGTTIVFATHDLQLAAEHAERLVVLDAGRVVADDTIDTVLRSDALDRVGLGRPPIARAFAAAPAPLRGITRMRELELLTQGGNI